MRRSLFLSVALSVPLATSAGQPSAVRIAALDSALRVEQAGGFSGVILIARGDSVLFERAYGRAAQLSVPPSGLSFWLASDSKQVTAAAILRLQEMGRLRTTDTIGRFLPGVPEERHRITIHQLLTHSAGFPHAYAADRIQSFDDAARRILSLKPVAAPGEKYSYSNDGYTLLALIIERASGMGFDAFVQSLFTDAGLTHSGVWGHEQSGVVIAPAPNPGRVARQAPTVFAQGRSIANWGYRGPTGVYASASDMHRWIQAIRMRRILTDASVKLLLGRHVLIRSDTTGQSFTGYGWGTRVERGADVSYGHSGNEDWLGHNAILRFTPVGDIVVVLSNSGDIDGAGWSSRVNRVVRRILDAR